MTSIYFKDSSNLLPHGAAVTSDLILWNGRPFFHQCSPQLLRCGGFTVAKCACSGNPTHFWWDSSRDWRQATVTRERHSPSGNGCIHEPHEDGRYHVGTQHDLRLAPEKVTQLGPGFHPCNGQRSGCRQWTPNLSDYPLILQPKPWRVDHPTCPLGVHSHLCTVHDISGKLFLCPETSSYHWRQPETIAAESSAYAYGTKRHTHDDVSESALIPRMADMVRFFQLGGDFRLFWPTLANSVSQWSWLQSVSLAGTCHADMLAGLHNLAMQSSNVINQIWYGRCWSQWCGHARC